MLSGMLIFVCGATSDSLPKVIALKALILSIIPPLPLQYSIMFLIKLIKYIKFYDEEHYILFNKMPERKARKYFNTSYMILLCFPLTKYGTNIKTISLNKMVTLCYNQVKNLPPRIMLAYF